MHNVYNSVHTLNNALPGPYVPVRVTRGALVAHWYTYAPAPAEPRSTAGLLFPSRCPSGTILLTQYSMVGDWWVSRAGRMPFFIGLSCTIPTIVFYSFSLSLLSVYRLVLWGWFLRTDRVYITLSLALRQPFLIIIIIIIIIIILYLWSRDRCVCGEGGLYFLLKNK